MAVILLFIRQGRVVLTYRIFRGAEELGAREALFLLPLSVLFVIGIHYGLERTLRLRHRLTVFDAVSLLFALVSFGTILFLAWINY